MVYLVNKFIKNNEFPSIEILKQYDPELDDFIYNCCSELYYNVYNREKAEDIGKQLINKGNIQYLMRCWLLLALVFKQSNNNKIRY